MSRERTVGSLIKDVEHLSGVKLKLVRLWDGWWGLAPLMTRL